MKFCFLALLLVIAEVANLVNGFVSLRANSALIRPVSSMRSSSSLFGAKKDGYTIAKTPSLNKGHSFSEYERGLYNLRGLFPAGEPMTLDTRVNVAMEQFRLKTSPIEKYQYLHSIQDSDETLFYAILIRHTAETMPIVYTPTVGEACQKWGKIFKHVPRGLYLSIKDKGHIHEILDNFPQKDVKAIVVTDGERILGLGDQGVNGMGIPIGKLALYTACAGVNPSQCLPVHIDVGTERAEYRSDPSYMGLRQPRVRGPEFDALIDEFFTACQKKYGRNVLIQFEDFGNSNAFKLLEAHRHTACTFNDDIQGTASVVLAGMIASLPSVNKKSLSDHTYLFYGAGEAGVGIANMVSTYIAKELKISEDEARKRVWLVDSKGLVTSARTDALAHHKQPYAHQLPTGAGAATKDILHDAIKLIKPSALVGVSAVGGAFTEAVCKEMATINKTPLIFALSNPTSKAECTAEQAYKWTDGRAVFASGSPFDAVTLPDGRKFIPGQGNNAYIFPGVGLGAIVAEASTITDDDLVVAAATLAKTVTPDRLKTGCAYPPLSDIRDVSLKIAAAVAENVVKDGRTSAKVRAELNSYDKILAKCEGSMYNPSYSF